MQLKLKHLLNSLLFVLIQQEMSAEYKKENLTHLLTCTKSSGKGNGTRAMLSAVVKLDKDQLI